MGDAVKEIPRHTQLYGVQASPGRSMPLSQLLPGYAFPERQAPLGPQRSFLPRTALPAPPRTAFPAPPRTALPAPPRTVLPEPPRTALPAPPRTGPTTSHHLGQHKALTITGQSSAQSIDSHWSIFRTKPAPHRRVHSEQASACSFPSFGFPFWLHARLNTTSGAGALT